MIPEGDVRAMVSKLGLLPLVSACALATTMPPELNCLPLLPNTPLCATSVWVAPSNRMPPPWSGGASSFFGQNLLFLNTLLWTTPVLPAPPGCPSSSTRMPWQFPLTRLSLTRMCRACRMKIPSALP